MIEKVLIYSKFKFPYCVEANCLLKQGNVTDVKAFELDKCKTVVKFKIVLNKSQIRVQCLIFSLEASMWEAVQNWLFYTAKANLKQC